MTSTDKLHHAFVVVVVVVVIITYFTVVECAVLYIYIYILHGQYKYF